MDEQLLLEIQGYMIDLFNNGLSKNEIVHKVEHDFIFGPEYENVHIRVSELANIYDELMDEPENYNEDDLEFEDPEEEDDD